MRNHLLVPSAAACLIACAPAPAGPGIRPIQAPLEIIQADTAGIDLRLARPAAVTVFEFSTTGWLKFLARTPGVIAPGDQRISIDRESGRLGRLTRSRVVPRYERPCVAWTSQPFIDQRTGNLARVPQEVCIRLAAGEVDPPPFLTYAGYWLILTTPVAWSESALDRALSTIHPDPVPSHLARQLLAMLPATLRAESDYRVIGIR